MDFVEEFRRRAARIDKESNVPVCKKETPHSPIEVPWDQKLYSIYKRSLPVNINFPVLMNLPEEDAKKALKRLKTKQHEDPDGGKHAIYYDMVLQSDERQKSVYWNDKPITKEGGNSDSLELLRGSEKFQETWVG